MQPRNYRHSTGNMSLPKLCIYLSVLLLAFAFSAYPAAAAGPLGNTDGVPTKEAVANMTEAQKQARIAEIEMRVKAIKAIDKSSLSKEERKALRMELRGLHKEAISFGRRNLFISIGATILVIVVLIIILH